MSQDEFQLAYQEEHDLEPVIIQTLLPLPPVKVDDPAAPVLIAGIFPVGENSLLVGTHFFKALKPNVC